VSEAVGRPDRRGRRLPSSRPAPERAARGGLRFVDDRLGSARWLRHTFSKIFPDHWSFMLGEIALYSFVILLLTGTFLAFFFKDSQTEILYHGSYIPLKGVSMSEAYASTLHISFDVRAGLLIRQIHHWAALLFVSAIFIHMLRIFFTGAFRKPREINWIIGVTLLVLALVEGFAGYTLPDDLLSGTGARIAASVAMSVPIVGTYITFFLFGGQFPGTLFIERLFILHVFVIPAILAALIGAHLAILWHQKHTDFPGPGKTEDNIVGTRFWPGYALKGQGYFFMVFGVVALLGAYVQINPIWLYGPYNPAQVSAGSQPDWYIGFLEGSLRIWPSWTTEFLGHTIVWNIFLPGVVLPGIMFTVLGVWPFLESRITGDHAFHNLLDRPRNRPNRTGFGVAGITFYLMLWMAGGNDLIAKTFNLSLQSTTVFFRYAVVLLPPIAFFVTRRWAIGLQQRDEHLLEHGIESGRILRMPTGEYIELTTPLPTPRRHFILQSKLGEQFTPELAEAHGDGHETPAVGEAGEPVETGSALSSAGRAISGFFFERRVRPSEEPEPPQTLHGPD
jgi:ubiquinol-cytochrome c reductase cytochrome b subunit